MGEGKEKHCNVKVREAEIARVTLKRIGGRFDLSEERGKWGSKKKGRGGLGGNGGNDNALGFNLLLFVLED